MIQRPSPSSGNVLKSVAQQNSASENSKCTEMIGRTAVKTLLPWLCLLTKITGSDQFPLETHTSPTISVISQGNISLAFKLEFQLVELGLSASMICKMGVVISTRKVMKVT